MKVVYQEVTLFLTFLLLWISIQFGQIIEDSIAYSIVLSIGIIHGANDLSILKKQEKNRRRFIKHVIGYLALILLCILSYLVYPFLSILLFIILSSFHFGEQHLSQKVTGLKSYKTLVYILYGMLIFSMLFIVNTQQIDLILENLTGTTIPVQWIEITLLVSGISIGLLFSYHYFIKKEYKLHLWKEIFYLLLLFLVFKTSSLILGFAVYFVLWHSIPSILDQTKYLTGAPSKKTIIRYVKKALIYWGLSIAGLFAAYYFVDAHYFNSIVFLTLFAVTAPHVWIMYRMNRNTNG